MDWYRENVETVAALLVTDSVSGLDDDVARQRFDQFGPNELIEQEGDSPWKILFNQFKETMVIILIIAAVISLLLGEFTDAIAIFVIVVINAIIGFRQEYKAEQAMAALKKLAVPTVRVRRNGHVKEVPSTTTFKTVFKP